MDKVIGLGCAILACFMSNGAIHAIDKGNVPAAIYSMLMTVALGGVAWICLSNNKRKEDKR